MRADRRCQDEKAIGDARVASTGDGPDISIVYVLQWVDTGKACVIGKVGADARMYIRPTYTTVKTNNSKTPSCYWRIVSEKKAKN